MRSRFGLNFLKILSNKLKSIFTSKLFCSGLGRSFLHGLGSCQLLKLLQLLLRNEASLRALERYLDGVWNVPSFCPPSLAQRSRVPPPRPREETCSLHCSTGGDQVVLVRLWCWGWMQDFSHTRRAPCPLSPIPLWPTALGRLGQQCFPS